MEKIKKISAIYCIENLLNGKKYIGQTFDLEKRWYDHKWLLEKNNHDNEYLQHSWNKNGGDSFDFKIIEECEVSKLDELEKYYIKLFQSRYDQNGYNLNDGGRGENPTLETRKKMSEAKLGKVSTTRTENKDGYVGARFKKNGWESSIRGPGSKPIYLGRYKTEKEAAIAYDKKALELYGKTFIFDEEFIRSAELPASKKTSKYVGVTKKNKYKWRARIDSKTKTNDNKSMSLGYYCSEILAAQNYDITALTIRGFSAKINFPSLLSKYIELINAGETKILEELFTDCLE
jgi:group I intron endonuclease